MLKIREKMQKLESDHSIDRSQSLVSPNGQNTLYIPHSGGGLFVISVN
jgi:hypothetical protein